MIGLESDHSIPETEEKNLLSRSGVDLAKDSSLNYQFLGVTSRHECTQCSEMFTLTKQVIRDSYEIVFDRLCSDSSLN